MVITPKMCSSTWAKGPFESLAWFIFFVERYPTDRCQTMTSLKRSSKLFANPYVWRKSSAQARKLPYFIVKTMVYTMISGCFRLRFSQDPIPYDPCMLYMVTFGVYWWDPCYHFSSSTMDPMGMITPKSARCLSGTTRNSVTGRIVMKEDRCPRRLVAPTFAVMAVPLKTWWWICWVIFVTGRKVCWAVLSDTTLHIYIIYIYIMEYIKYYI